MNVTFDGARIRQQELDREIDALRAERLLSRQLPQRPGPLSRGLASVGRGMIRIGTALASRVEGSSAPRSAESGGRA